MAVTEFDVETLASEYDQKRPQEIIKLAMNRFESLAISFSGADDVVLVDMAVKINPDIQVFSLDTGRLHAKTYLFLEQVRKHYNIQLDILFPDSDAVRKMVMEKGLYSFYTEGHRECCGIRKVAPLRRKLATLDAWITGQRKDQNPDTRASVQVIETDNAFSSPGNKLIKFNPLANWKSAQIWQYIRENDVPFNELHNHGYISIGCEPCTRPVLPN